MNRIFVIMRDVLLEEYLASEADRGLWTSTINLGYQMPALLLSGYVYSTILMMTSDGIISMQTRRIKNSIWYRPGTWSRIQ